MFCYMIALVTHTHTHTHTHILANQYRRIIYACFIELIIYWLVVLYCGCSPFPGDGGFANSQYVAGGPLLLCPRGGIRLDDSSFHLLRKVCARDECCNVFRLCFTGHSGPITLLVVQYYGYVDAVGCRGTGVDDALDEHKDPNCYTHLDLALGFQQV
jgi:hypothetical protein